MAFTTTRLSLEAGPLKDTWLLDSQVVPQNIPEQQQTPTLEQKPTPSTLIPPPLSKPTRVYAPLQSAPDISLSTTPAQTMPTSPKPSTLTTQLVDSAKLPSSEPHVPTASSPNLASSPTAASLSDFLTVADLHKYLDDISSLGCAKVDDLSELESADIEALGMTHIEEKRMQRHLRIQRCPAISNFLIVADLHKYFDTISRLGCIKVVDLLELRPGDIETLGMSDVEVKRMRHYLDKRGHRLRHFLSGAGLDKYFDALSDLGCTKVDDLIELEAEDAEELGMKRIEVKRMHRHLDNHARGAL